MPLMLAQAPAVEPVSVDAVKQFLKIDQEEEDLLIAALILAARTHVEKLLQMGLITQKWFYYVDNWPADGVLTVPLSPLQDVLDITYFEAPEAAQSVQTDRYEVDKISRPGRIIFRDENLKSVPLKRINGIKIWFSCGFGDDQQAVPEPLRHALKILIAHWYERRELVTTHGPLERISMISLTGSYGRVQQSFGGRGLKPLSPVHVRGRRVGGDIVLSWIRRTRTSGDSWVALEVALGEEFEAYECDVLGALDGRPTVLRTLKSNEPTVLYGEEAQVQDWGQQAVNFMVHVYQLSATLGRGTARKVQLYVPLTSP